MNLELVPVALPDGTNVVIGQTHFIKTVEDLYEIVVTGVPHAQFGVAFNEASGPRLVRVEGNTEDLRAAAAQAALAIGAGHIFVLFLRDAYPINLLNQIKSCRRCAASSAPRRTRYRSSSRRATRAAACSVWSTANRRKASKAIRIGKGDRRSCGRSGTRGSAPLLQWKSGTHGPASIVHTHK